jgi:hypothetical protein
MTPLHRQAMPRIVSDPPVRLVREARRHDLALNEVREPVLPLWAWLLLVAVATLFAGQWVLR